MSEATRPDAGCEPDHLENAGRATRELAPRPFRDVSEWQSDLGEVLFLRGVAMATGPHAAQSLELAPLAKVETLTVGDASTSHRQAPFPDRSGERRRHCRGALPLRLVPAS